MDMSESIKEEENISEHEKKPELQDGSEQVEDDEEEPILSLGDINEDSVGRADCVWSLKTFVLTNENKLDWRTPRNITYAFVILVN
jgi:hypothetical protein